MANGLTFKKLDLHVHTHGSHDFTGVTPTDIVEEALRKDLDGIAITDHNTGIAIDDIKQAARGRELVVFPGVEVTCRGGKSGLHIIALFDPSKDSSYIKGFLNALDIRDDQQGTPSALADKDVIDVIDIIEKWEGIAVPAHANSAKGILCDMAGEQRTKTVQHPKLLTIEATDFENESKASRRRRVVDLLDGTDSTYKRKLAVYQASDSKIPDSDVHSLEGIGTHCAYFKLEKINLEGLRQCFIDPDVRIRQDFEYTSWDYPFIKSVNIHSGFLDEQSVEFHRGLTSILGSKGSGKSLLIEFMRFALNQEPDHPSIKEDHADKLRERLEEYGVVKIIFVDETGKEFEINRTFREIDESPYDDSVPYDPAQVCPVLFLSQNEIIKIAENEQAQLEFIDRFFDFRSYKTQIESYENQLEKLDKQMAEGLRSYGEIEELNSKITTLETEIQKLDQALSHPIFEKFKRLELKERVFTEQTSHFDSIVDNIEKTRRKIASEVMPSLPDFLSQDPALKRNRDALIRANELLAGQLSTLVNQLSRERQNVETEHQNWYSSAFKEGKKEYDEYIQSMGADYRGLAVNRERASRQLKELQKRKANAESKKQSVREISQRRDELLDLLDESYKQYSQERRVKCEKFQNDSANKLELRILDSSNRDEFRNRLLSLKRGSYLREDEINMLCNNISPRSFVMSLLRYDATHNSKLWSVSTSLLRMTH